MTRVAIAGFRHESNCFAARKTDLEDFETQGVYPSLVRGAALFEATKDMSGSLQGFMHVARDCRWDLVPLLWCFAKSSAQVTDRAFDTITGWIIEHLKGAGPVDAVYLDLHGGMVTESHDDGEGELIRRLRESVRPDVPIVAALDFHANVTRLGFDNATVLAAYRTNPHMDKVETGERVGWHLNAVLNGEGARFKAMRKIPFLVPGPWQYTGVDPLKSLFRKLGFLEGQDAHTLSMTVSYTGGDVYELGPAVFGYGHTQKAADDAVDALFEAFMAQEHAFVGTLYVPDDAVREALGLFTTTDKPIILVDTEDNPGGGSPADSMAVFKALVAQGAENAVVAMICDTDVVAQAHAAGTGARIDVRLGGKSGLEGNSPFEGTMEVVALGDGDFEATGPMDRGLKMNLGPMALLRSGGVSAIVCGKRQRATDQSILRHLGLEPKELAIIALKETTHFLSDYGAIGGPYLFVEGPGLNVADTRKLPYRNLHPDLRIYPGGPAFADAKKVDDPGTADI